MPSDQGPFHARKVFKVRAVRDRNINTGFGVRQLGGHGHLRKVAIFIFRRNRVRTQKFCEPNYTCVEFFDDNLRVCSEKIYAATSVDFF